MEIGLDLAVDNDADNEGDEELDNENDETVQFARFSNPVFHAVVNSIFFKPLNTIK